MKEHLNTYIENFIVPTVEEFNANPSSVRHGFLACLVIYHAADRMVYPDRNRKQIYDLKEDWRNASLEFRLIELVANQFKHVVRRDKLETISANTIHLVHALGLDETAETIELHHLFFIVRDAVSFLKKQAET